MRRTNRLIASITLRHVHRISKIAGIVHSYLPDARIHFQINAGYMGTEMVIGQKKGEDFHGMRIVNSNQ